VSHHGPPFFFRPAGLLFVAAGQFGAFALVHALGWRQDTSFISMTFADGTDAADATLRGTVYMAAYFSAVLSAPVLVLASIFLAVWNRLRPETSRPTPQASAPTDRQ
jgi:hypothetical protein